MEHSQGLTHILWHKTNLPKFKSIEIVSSIFSAHNGIKLEPQEKKWEKTDYKENKQHATKKKKKTISNEEIRREI